MFIINSNLLHLYFLLKGLFWFNFQFLKKDFKKVNMKGIK